MTTPDLATSLRALRDGGRKLLVPYITGGYPGWQDAIRACAANGADADDAGVATIMLAAPTAPDDRLPRIVERARGFVYSVGLLGVTGERDTLAETATALAERLKAVTDTPVLVGVGVSNAEQAATAVQVADGVIQGASMVRRLMESGPDEVGRYVAEVRAAIDAV
ncbi:MAG: hypothetical protein EBY57_05315 [Actinobacteria bacterium]|nr:hypothetical protein [Actinomycetota bacterium]